MTFRLCYIEGHCAWFADAAPHEVWGDDWDNRPRSMNAGPPSGPHRFRRVYFDADWIEHADDWISAGDINWHGWTWALLPGGRQLLSGCAYEDFIAAVMAAPGGMAWTPISE